MQSKLLEDEGYIAVLRTYVNSPMMNLPRIWLVPEGEEEITVGPGGLVSLSGHQSELQWG